MGLLDAQILLADNHLLAVAKPAGVPVVPDPSGDPSLLEDARAWVRDAYQKPGRVFLGVVHRLDRPVSGVVLFARTSKAAARLSAAWRRGEVQKLYWGLTAGPPPAQEGLLEQWLVKDRERNRVRPVKPPGPQDAPAGARLARTRWRVLLREAGLAVLELEPLTGRSHQLRIACATLGCPLLGDLKYGADEALPDQSVALHARSLAFRHPTRDEPVRVAASAPAVFPPGLG